MKKKSMKILLGVVAALFLIGLACAGTGCYLLFAPQFHPAQTVYVCIDRDDTVDSIYNKVEAVACPGNLIGFFRLNSYRRYAQSIHTGRYAIRPGDNAYTVSNRLCRGHQTPTDLVVGSVRTLDKLAANVGRQLMLDSAEIAVRLNDTAFVRQLGYRPETLPSLFIPNTYEVYWNIGADAFFARMQREHQRFWNSERLKKAQAIGLSPEEVATLASIVEEETNNAAEKPVVAGLYINRLKRGMLLQADPTVKFALQDFGLKRVTRSNLNVQSPYNTYLHAGLPPGPIRIPTPQGLDAVLNYTRHNYLYMCAKEDFSGTHNFASNYADHARNARKYWKALNERKIFR